MDGVGELLPLVGRRVDAGRIVAAGVQQQHVAGRNLIDARQEGVPGEAVGLGVEVGHCLRGHARRGEDLRMVGPSRLGHPERRLGHLPMDQVGRHPQGTGPARCVARGDAARGDRFVAGTEHQLLHGRGVCGRAGDRQVRLRRLLLDDSLSRSLDRFEHGRLTAGVLIDADAEIDLLRVRIGTKRLGEAEDRIGGGRLNGFKHGLRYFWVRFVEQRSPGVGRRRTAKSFFLYY